MWQPEGEGLSGKEEEEEEEEVEEVVEEVELLHPEGRKAIKTRPRFNMGTCKPAMQVEGEEQFQVCNQQRQQYSPFSSQ